MNNDFKKHWQVKKKPLRLQRLPEKWDIRVISSILGFLIFASKLLLDGMKNGTEDIRNG